MEQDRERDERTVHQIRRLAEQATELERWSAERTAGQPDRPASPGWDEAARIGDPDGTVRRWDEAARQWVVIGRIEGAPRFGTAESAPGEGSKPFTEWVPIANRFATADDVLDWWPEGDDTYRGSDGQRVRPPTWIRLEDWQRAVVRQAFRTPRQDAGTGRRTWNRQLEAYLDARARNRHPSGCGEDGAEVGAEVAGSHDGPGPYYWPGTGQGRLAALAEFTRWAARYRQAWELEQGQQPPAQPVRPPLRWSSGEPVIDNRRIEARRDVRGEWRAFRRVVRSVRDIEARRLVVAVRQAARLELWAAEWWLEPNAWQRIDRAGERAAELGRWIGHEASLWWVARPRPFWNGKG